MFELLEYWHFLARIACCFHKMEWNKISYFAHATVIKPNVYVVMIARAPAPAPAVGKCNNCADERDANKTANERMGECLFYCCCCCLLNVLT